MSGQGWNRLTNGLRAALSRLPVWTTETDRRLALSYKHSPLWEAQDAIEAVRAGRQPPANLGEILAVARYEDAGWMPDGSFEKWRRQEGHGLWECLNVTALVQWLEARENDMRRTLRAIEHDLTSQCQSRRQDLLLARSRVDEVQQRLHAHRQKLILACLSTGNMVGAREIVQRMPPGSERFAFDKSIREYDTDACAASDVMKPEPPTTTTPATGLGTVATPATELAELAERRRLDPLRSAEIEELIRRRQADLCTEERVALEHLKQLMTSDAHRTYPHGPTLIALANRLLTGY